MKFLKFALILIIILGILGIGGTYFLVKYQVKGKYFNSNGINIHYTDEGRGEAVILLHGFAANSNLNFRKPGIIKLLKKEFRVVAMDLRGHGLSDKPHDSSKYGIEMVYDVIRLMDYLKIKKAHIVGYSMGGAITLKLATIAPERMITASPLGMGWEVATNSRLAKLLPDLQKALKKRKGINPLAENIGTHGRRVGFLHTFMIRCVTKYFNDRYALSALLSKIMDFKITEDELRNIPVPVLSIIGSNDPLKLGVDAMVGKVKNHKVVVIEGANHITAVMSKKLKKNLINFLRENRNN